MRMADNTLQAAMGSVHAVVLDFVAQCDVTMGRHVEYARLLWWIHQHTTRADIAMRARALLGPAAYL